MNENVTFDLFMSICEILMSYMCIIIYIKRQ